MNLLPRTRAVATEEDQTDSDSDSNDSSVDNGSTRSRRGRKRTRRYVEFKKQTLSVFQDTRSIIRVVDQES